VPQAAAEKQRPPAWTDRAVWRLTPMAMRCKPKMPALTGSMRCLCPGGGAEAADAGLDGPRAVALGRRAPAVLRVRGVDGIGPHAGVRHLQPPRVGVQQVKAAAFTQLEAMHRFTDPGGNRRAGTTALLLPSHLYRGRAVHR